MKTLTDYWIDILMILSDDQGHSSVELTECLKIGTTNISPMIGKLENRALEGDWDYVIDSKDIRDPKSLFSLILDNKDEISKYINSRINPNVGVPSSDEQLSIFCAKLLNEFLINANIFEDKSFLGTKENLLDFLDLLLLGRTHGYVFDLPSLNRLLLPSCFSCELLPYENRIIYRVHERSRRHKDKNYHEDYCYINRNLHIFDFILMNLANNLKKDLSPHYSPELIVEEPDRLYIKTSNSSYESKNLDRINNFLFSRYASKLIQKFGLKLIFDITKNRTKEFVTSVE